MKKMLTAMVLLAISTIALAAPPLTICTGGPTGAYEALGTSVGKSITEKLKVSAPTEFVVLNTGGSIENGERLTNGSCVMAVMQADAVAGRGLPRDIKVTNAHVEAIYWIHGKDGLKDFSDLAKPENKDLGIAVVTGSGSYVTIQNFGAVDEDYKDLNLIPFEDWEFAAEAAAEGNTRIAGKQVNIAGMLYVSRPGFLPGAITNDYSRDLTVGEVTEDAFTKATDFNGNELYYECSIKRGDTGPLEVDSWGSPDTLCMNAQVVFNNDYLNNVPATEVRAVKKAVLQGTNQILRNAR